MALLLERIIPVSVISGESSEVVSISASVSVVNVS